ncbi:MAG: hypothetical protein EAX86_06555 [Candidatus Heimdallarchaeota archaeon]|nr:hypothetical protein [Candidatus Heimdallarchaeota archaeon]
MIKTIFKKFIRKKAWGTHKKAITQVLIPRCRRDGVPEYGRFTYKDIERIIFQTESNIRELMSYFKNLDNIGNYMMQYAGLIYLAIYRALKDENIDSTYAMNLIGDIQWQYRMNSNGLFPILDPLRLKLAKFRAKSPIDFLGKRLEDALKYPYTEPGYKAKLYKDKDVYCMNLYSCTVFDFYKQFGQEEITLFRRTWCTYDFAVAEYLVEGGKYEREHTLSDGDEVCDMKFFIGK